MEDGYIKKQDALDALYRAQRATTWSMDHIDTMDQMIDYVEKLPVEEVDIDELKKEVSDLRNRLHLIWALGYDYDGCNTVESLKELIDELVSYTQLPREQVPDITSRTGRWVVCGDGDYVPFKCTACGNNTSWYHKQTAKYCPNCGAKMIKE